MRFSRGVELIRLDMSYIDFVLLIEKTLRENIVCEDKEYRDIADKIAKRLTNER